MLEFLCNLANETGEGQLAQKGLRRLLVAANLAERDGPRAEAMGLLTPPVAGVLLRFAFGC